MAESDARRQRDMRPDDGMAAEEGVLAEQVHRAAAPVRTPRFPPHQLGENGLGPDAAPNLVCSMAQFLCPFSMIPSRAAVRPISCASASVVAG